MATFGSYFTKKVIVSLSVVATILSIVGGIWAFEAHYATNKRVDGVAYAAKSQVEELELQIASALQNQEMKSNIKFYEIIKDKINEDLFKLRRKIEENPDDDMLKRDYDEMKKRKENIQDEIDDSMKKIKVN